MSSSPAALAAALLQIPGDLGKLPIAAVTQGYSNAIATLNELMSGSHNAVPVQELLRLFEAQAADLEAAPSHVGIAIDDLIARL